MQTISMSRCSSIVLRVNGRVGLVEDGSTFFRPAILMISGAWPPPAAFGVEGVDGAALERLHGVLDEPDSFSVSECSITWTS